MRDHEHDTEIEASLQAAREAVDHDAIARAKAEGYDHATKDAFAWVCAHVDNERDMYMDERDVFSFIAHALRNNHHEGARRTPPIMWQDPRHTVLSTDLPLCQCPRCAAERAKESGNG